MQLRLCLPLLSCLLTLSSGSLPFRFSPKAASAREIPTANRQARETARAAIHYLNYLAGSPNNLLMLLEVTKATVQDIPGIGHKYYIHFTTRDFQTNEKVGTCFGTIFFHTKKPRPAVNVNCTNNKSQKQVQEDDYSLYKKMKHRIVPVTGGDIPDRFGYVDPSLEPLRDLALAGSSFVMWEKSTEDVHYYMAQIKTVNQWLRKDDFIDLDYNIVLHEIPTQEMVSCHIRVVWYPGQPLKVKYDCSPVQRSEESEEGSAGGQSDEGSASYGNF